MRLRDAPIIGGMVKDEQTSEEVVGTSRNYGKANLC